VSTEREPTASARLAEHFTDTGYAQLAEPLLHEMRRLLLDYCGVALSGSREPTGQIVHRFVVGLGGAEQATVLGSTDRVPMMHAAFANAVAEHSIELDDVDDLALFHYGPPIVSAALAATQHRGASGHDLLVAMLAGGEMINRLSLATNPALRDHGFHTTPACGVFGAAVAAGRLLGLDTAQLTSALGLAGAQAGGLMEMYGPSMQKRINPGPAARDGVVSAELAALGFVGADTILDGVRGFGAAFADGLDAERLLADLGESIPVTVEYKPYSAARPIHNGIDCALNIRRAHAPDPQQIERIVIHRHPAWANYHTNTSPSTYHEAQVSLPFSVALAFVEGRAFPDQYADERLGRSELTNVAHRVEIRTQEDLPRGVSCRMVVTMQDGTEFQEQVDYPKGSTGNPMDDAELEQKFRHLAEPVLGADRLDRAVAAIWSIDQSPDVSELLDALSPAGPVS
jgi:2-methylcitrate dehydratase PrpD